MIITKPLAEFEFKNLDFELINQAINEVYINIDRVFRTAPLAGMKQPTPRGGMMGYEAILKLKYKGQPAFRYRWELYITDQYRTTLIQSGITIDRKDHTGKLESYAGNLDISLPYGELITYKIKIFIPATFSRKKKSFIINRSSPVATFSRRHVWKNSD